MSGCGAQELGQAWRCRGPQQQRGVSANQHTAAADEQRQPALGRRTRLFQRVPARARGVEAGHPALVVLSVRHLGALRPGFGTHAAQQSPLSGQPSPCRPYHGGLWRRGLPSARRPGARCKWNHVPQGAPEALRAARERARVQDRHSSS